MVFRPEVREGARDGEVHAMAGPSPQLAICNLQCFFAFSFAQVTKSMQKCPICRIQTCHKNHDLYDIMTIYHTCFGRNG